MQFGGGGWGWKSVAKWIKLTGSKQVQETAPMQSLMQQRQNWRAMPLWIWTMDQISNKKTGILGAHEHTTDLQKVGGINREVIQSKNKVCQANYSTLWQGANEGQRYKKVWSSMVKMRLWGTGKWKGILVLNYKLVQGMQGGPDLGGKRLNKKRQDRGEVRGDCFCLLLPDRTYGSIRTNLFFWVLGCCRMHGRGGGRCDSWCNPIATGRNVSPADVFFQLTALLFFIKSNIVRLKETQATANELHGVEKAKRGCSTKGSRNYEGLR